MNQTSKSDSVILLLGGVLLLAFPSIGGYFAYQKISENRILWEQGVPTEARVLSKGKKYYLIYSANESGSRRELDKAEYDRFKIDSRIFGEGASVEIENEIIYSFRTTDKILVENSEVVQPSTFETAAIGDTVDVHYLPNDPETNDVTENISPTIGKTIFNVVIVSVLILFSLPGLFLLKSGIIGTFSE